MIKIYECDVCGQRFESKLRWHSTQRKIYDGIGGYEYWETKYCKGVLRRVLK